MPWTCGKNTCPSRYTFFGKGCKRILFRGLERATWTGYSNSKNRPLTLFEKEYYDPPPAYRRRPEITRMEAQTASARGYLKLPGRHPFPAAGGQRKGTSLRMSLSFGTPEGIRTSVLPLRRRSLYPAELSAHIAFATVLSISDTTHFVNLFFHFFAIIFTYFHYLHFFGFLYAHTSRFSYSPIIGASWRKPIFPPSKSFP